MSCWYLIVHTHTDKPVCSLDIGLNKDTSWLQVRCIVRPRQNPADFLRDWGATTVQADLNDPTSLPAALVGIHTVIDCSTARPEENTQRIDWEGKVALIQCAQVCHHCVFTSSALHCSKLNKIRHVTILPAYAVRLYSAKLPILNRAQLWSLTHAPGHQAL